MQNQTAAPTPTQQEYTRKPSQYTVPDKATVSLDSILKKRIDGSIEVKPVVPTVFIAGSRFAVKGDISMISGKPKAGKSTITKMVLATALMKERKSDVDTLGIESVYCDGKTVIYIDTEQNPSDTKQFYEEVLQIAGLTEKEAPHFLVLNWRDLDYNECLQHLASVFELIQDIHMIILDGITDLIPSANDETSSVMLIRYLMKESTTRNVCIIALIHENGDSGKMRGHIGAEASRKCQGTISIRYDEAKKVRVIKPLFLRRGKMFEEIYWESHEGIPKTCDAEIITALKEQEASEEKKNKEAYDIVKKMFEKTPLAGLPTADLMKLVRTYQESKNNESADACRKRASRMIDKIKKLELIEEIDGLWFDKNREDNQL